MSLLTFFITFLFIGNTFGYPLNQYARPPNDTGRGLHWSPDQYAWGDTDNGYGWYKWAQRLKKMKLKWLKVIVAPDYTADSLTKRVIDLDIMPVVRFITKNPTTMDGAHLAVIQRVINMGGFYFETNNEPDANNEWDEKKPDNWEWIVVDNLITDANNIGAMGGCTALVVFNSDPGKPNAAQIWVNATNGMNLLKNNCIWMSVHNYGRGRPIEYPNDNIRMFGTPVTDAEWTQIGLVPTDWTQSQIDSWVWGSMTRDQINAARANQSDSNVTIMTDITGFRMYEYWLNNMANALKDHGYNPNDYPVPIMMTEGGWETHDRLDDFYPYPTVQDVSDLTLDMMGFIQNTKNLTLYNSDGSTYQMVAPPTLMALMPWLAGEQVFDGAAGTWESQAWWSDWWDPVFELNGTLPVVPQLNNFPSVPKANINGIRPTNWTLRDKYNPNYLLQDLTHWDYRFRYLTNGAPYPLIKYNEPSKYPAFIVMQGLLQEANQLNKVIAMTDGYIYVKAEMSNGTGIENQMFCVKHGTDVDTVYTKASADQFYGNYMMTAVMPTYSIWINTDTTATKCDASVPPNSAMITGLGLGGENPGSEGDRSAFAFTFQMVDSAPPPVNDPIFRN